MDFNKLKQGDILSSTMYLTVQSKDNDSIKVKDSFGREFTVKGPKLIEETMNSAQQFTKEEKVSRTKAAEVFTNVGDSVFTVVFDKADGSERVLVGKLLNTEGLMGRSNVTDLQITSGSNLRLVDHRSIKSLIAKGTKYTVKK